MTGKIKWQVEFYEKENGRCPVREFLNGLPKQDLVFIENGLNRLERYGKELERPHAGYLRDHIHELRVQTKGVQYRFLYFFYHETIIVVTHGIIKKSKKVPDVEIDKAFRNRQEYFRRQENKG